MKFSKVPNMWLYMACFLAFFFSARTASCLECYVCQNQDNNKNKCVETVKTCDVNQEMCSSEVRWGATPDWKLTSQKQHFISKRCATKFECLSATMDFNKKCHRISYNDWNCTSCCIGDRCNYFVTLGASSLVPSTLLLFVSLLITFTDFKKYVISF